MFNRIETWELLEESLGGISLAAYNQHVRLLPPEPWFGLTSTKSTQVGGSRHCHVISFSASCASERAFPPTPQTEFSSPPDRSGRPALELFAPGCISCGYASR